MHTQAIHMYMYLYIKDLIDTMITTLQYSPFAVFVWPTCSPLLRCCIHRIWLVILFVPRRVRGHSMRSLLFPGTYSHTWVFTSVRVVFTRLVFWQIDIKIECLVFISTISKIHDFDLRLLMRDCYLKRYILYVSLSIIEVIYLCYTYVVDLVLCRGQMKFPR